LHATIGMVDKSTVDAVFPPSDPHFQGVEG
jgi:hypothetical protein